MDYDFIKRYVPGAPAPLNRLADQLAQTNPDDSLREFLNRWNAPKGSPAYEQAQKEWEQFAENWRSYAGEARDGIQLLAAVPSHQREVPLAQLMPARGTNLRLGTILPDSERQLIDDLLSRARSSGFAQGVRKLQNFSDALLLGGHGGLRGWIQMARQQPAQAEKLLKDHVGAKERSVMRPLAALLLIHGVDLLPSLEKHRPTEQNMQLPDGLVAGAASAPLPPIEFAALRRAMDQLAVAGQQGVPVTLQDVAAAAGVQGQDLAAYLHDNGTLRDTPQVNEWVSRLDWTQQAALLGVVASQDASDAGDDLDDLLDGLIKRSSATDAHEKPPSRG